MRSTAGDVYANALNEADIDQWCINVHKENTVYLASDNTTETAQVFPESMDVSFLDEFFDGKTWLNTETDTDESKLKDTALFIKEVYDEIAQSKRIAQINLKQFNQHFDLNKLSNNAQSPESNNFDCEIPAIMCCWTRDRQADDNNGNCARPYESRCVDADPADNTDICYTDAQRSPTSFHTDIGFSFFGGDEDNEQDEGDSHCHGFIYRPDEPLSVDNVYSGNNLFYVSLYDHLYQRGYVESVAGGPMCGCMEQMPTVSRSDCTEMRVDAVFTVGYGAQGVATIEQTSLDIDFRACNGNPENNDLFSKYVVYYADDAETGTYDISRRLVGSVDNDLSYCPTSLTDAYAQDTELNFRQEDQA